VLGGGGGGGKDKRPEGSGIAPKVSACLILKEKVLEQTDPRLAAP